VSCQLDPSSKTKPNYSSTLSGIAGGGNAGGYGLLAGPILAGMQAAAESPGQAKVERISKDSGSVEKQFVLESIRKQLVAEGYTVRADAPSTMVVHVSDYGVHKLMHGETYIRINARLDLKDSAGKAIWMSNYLSSLPPAISAEVQADGVTTTGCPKTLPKLKFDEYVANPDLYRRDFEDQSKSFAKVIVAIPGTFSSEYDPTKTQAKP
jgi:hypothetical protein